MKPGNDEAEINPYTAPDSDFLYEEDPSDFCHGKIWLRATALFIDTILAFALELLILEFYNGVIFSVLYPFLGQSLPTFNRSPITPLLLLLTIMCFYCAVMESSSLQATLGKKCMGLLVTDTEGKRISLGSATLRFFAKTLSLLLGGIGFFIQPFTTNSQTLHDLLAGTYVILQE